VLQRLAMDDGIAAPRDNRALEFARARRHSRLVRVLRTAIPIGCFIAVALPVAWTLFNPFSHGNVSFDVGSVRLSDNKVTMEAPRLTGYKKDNRAYVVNARSAAQDPRKPNIVELTDIAADIDMPNDGKARLESAFGIYDTLTENLSLQKDIHLRTRNGYDIRTGSADIQFKAGRVVAPGAVQVSMNGGTIAADRMEILDNGNEIVFDGHVVSEFNREGGAGDQPGVQARP